MQACPTRACVNIRGNTVNNKQSAPRNLGEGLRAHSNNRERSFWQSRMTRTGHRAEPIELADIHALARKVRRTCPQYPESRITSIECHMTNAEMRVYSGAV
jgi:hypothetical protein